VPDDKLQGTALLECVEGFCRARAWGVAVELTIAVEVSLAGSMPFARVCVCSVTVSSETGWVVTL
jgi:hypothetical protein